VGSEVSTEEGFDDEPLDRNAGKEGEGGAARWTHYRWNDGMPKEGMTA
jgi:hypothetical protein